MGKGKRLKAERKRKQSLGLLSPASGAIEPVHSTSLGVPGKLLLDANSTVWKIDDDGPVNGGALKTVWKFLNEYKYDGYALLVVDSQSKGVVEIECNFDALDSIIMYMYHTEKGMPMSYIGVNPKTKKYVVSMPFSRGRFQVGKKYVDEGGRLKLVESDTSNEFLINKAGAKIYYNNPALHESLPIPLVTDVTKGGTVYDVLSVGKINDGSIVATVKHADASVVAYKIPEELSDWANHLMEYAQNGVKLLPEKVEFGILDGRVFAEIH